MPHSILFALLPVLAVNSATLADTITVDTLYDDNSIPQTITIDDLPGPDGRISFREAVYAADNTPGPQTIAFAIPQSEFWLLTDMALLECAGPFVLYHDDTTIDFSTQTSAIGNTNINGPEVGMYGLEPNGWGTAAIFIFGNRNTIKGLGNVYQRGHAVQMFGDDNRIIGCDIEGTLGAAIATDGYPDGTGYTGYSADRNIIGGVGPGEGNRLIGGGSGVEIRGVGDGNIVIGNFLSGPSSGVHVVGATQYGYHVRNTRIGGPTSAERNHIAGAGKMGEEGLPTGTQVSIEDADGTIVEGNYIGTNSDGTAAFSPQRGPGGVSVNNSRGTIIRNNLISGLRSFGTNHYAGQVFGVAISALGQTSGTVVTGNKIGVTADGFSSIPTVSGVDIGWFQGYPNSTTIGGAVAGQGNLIAFTETFGVRVGSGAVGVAISGNSIHSNGTLGIDLLTTSNAAGVTPNDPLDADTGGNGLQNFPTISSARAAGSGTLVSGSLDSLPATAFRLEFFSSATCAPSGFGQGRTYLGATSVSTDASGHAPFSAVLTTPTSSGEVVTATATRVTTGDTSEFSACTTVTPGLIGDINGDCTVGTADLTILLGSFGQSVTAGLSGDLNLDGVVNTTDLTALLGAFGSTCR